jgi:uncharacterized protein YaiI (UPF0178 family)
MSLAKGKELKKQKIMKIWIDADACPKVIKEIIFRATIRQKIPLYLVANSYQTIPHSEWIRLIIVEKGSDKADQYIVEHVNPNELVITADIPLASLIVEKGAIGINPRGEIYTEENIGEILSMRDFMQNLRNEGSVTGGPATFSTKESHAFSNSLNKFFN